MREVGINMELVKKKNRSSILQLINRTGPISRKDIALRLGLTPAAVTQLCRDFMDSGILKTVGTIASTDINHAGRKKVLIDLNYEHRYVVGINIEKKNTTIALADLKGTVRCINTIPTNNKIEPMEFLKTISERARNMYRDLKIATDMILGIGVGIVGIVDKEKGRSIKAYGIWDSEVDICEILSEELGAEVYIENNVTAFALAEMIFGEGRDKDNLFFVKWGPGVGSAIVIQNKIYEGRNSKAAELGHFIVERKGKKCRCGRYGCLETKLSIDGIREEVSKIFSADDSKALYYKLKGDIRNLTEDNIEELLLCGDEKVVGMMEELIDLFARCIVNSGTILAPNKVVLCGSVFKNDVIRKKVIESCNYYDYKYNSKSISLSKLAECEEYIGPVAVVVNDKLFS